MEKKLTTKTTFGGFSTKTSSVQKSIRSGPMNERFFTKPDAEDSGVMTFDKEEIKYCEGADCDQEEPLDSSYGASAEFKPLKVAWFFDEKDFIPNEEGQMKLSLKDGVARGSKLGVSQCPGKRIQRGRDGKTYDRNIFRDVEHYR